MTKLQKSLIDARAASGLSADDFAADYGVSTRTLQGWEKGVEPCVWQWQVLANILDCDLYKIADMTGYDIYKVNPVGREIRLARAQRGVRLVDLCRVLHVASGTLKKWETSIYDISDEYFERIAKWLGVSIRTLGEVADGTLRLYKREAKKNEQAVEEKYRIVRTASSMSYQKIWGRCDCGRKITCNSCAGWTCRSGTEWLRWMH